MKLPNIEEARRRENKKSKIILDDYQREDFGFLSSSIKSFYIKTYGCQMNEHDSEKIKAMLIDLGFEEIDDYEKADIIILNTCSVRENANNKVFGMVGRIKHLKETRPNVIAGICGCMAQEEEIAQRILKKYKFLDFVFGTHNLHKLPQILKKSIEEESLQIEVLSNEGDIFENIPVKRDSKISAWVDIIYGCDKFCTYCIVPYTRGKQRSRTKEFIIDEVKRLKSEGYKEVTLLGQNVNAYGKDLYKDYYLSNLMEDIAQTGIDRIRFLTSHPWDFTDELIEIISKYENIMPYIHLPVQSGSTEILKRMGRKYTIEEYKNLFNKIKNKMPNAAISTDIIVGFPNETKEDFDKTLELANYCKFDAAFTFIYSKRSGTVAANMEDNISKEEKQERLLKLNEIINKYTLENNKKLEGETINVLLDSVSNKKGFLKGTSETMKLINVKTDNLELIGTIVKAKITSAKTFSLDGELS